jgi:hypothetical protein
VIDAAASQQALISALRERRPLVFLLGQDAWTSTGVPDRLLETALRHLGREEAIEKGWPAQLDATSLPDNYYEWLAERFLFIRQACRRYSHFHPKIGWSVVVPHYSEQKLERRDVQIIRCLFERCRLRDRGLVARAALSSPRRSPGFEPRGISRSFAIFATRRSSAFGMGRSLRIAE